MADPTAPERHAASVPNPCGVEHSYGHIADPTHVCNHIPSHGTAADDPIHICACGLRWDEQGRAPVEDLLGADPDYLGGQSVDDYIREARRDR
jgi:hypothetical protein